MKLILFNSDSKLKTSFKNYIKEWEKEIPKPNEDYYKMYSMFLDNYEASMEQFLNASTSKRLENDEPFVKFYWLVDSSLNIVGTIRYRINIPALYGNVGYEISPKHRHKGFGKKMLIQLKKELKINGTNSLIATVRKENNHSIKLLESQGAIRKGTVSSEDLTETLLKFELNF
tara:strand:+ start:34 stop:552 length:519 start_codon:yes stop_codon:yes gene_type:complete